RSLSHLHSLVFAEFNYGDHRQSRGERPLAQEALERITVLSAEHGFTSWSALATRLHGWILFNQGRKEEGVAEMQEGHADTVATGINLGIPTWRTALAKAYMETGRLDEASHALREALTLIEQSEERISEASTYQVKGELLLKQDRSNIGEAQQCFERSI